jgi:hypothetical protein
MPTEQERQEIRRVIQEINSLEAQLLVANKRLDELIDGARLRAAVAANADIADPRSIRSQVPRHKGKVADPASLSQRVLQELMGSEQGMSISALARNLGTDPKRIRNAVVYHQKRGTVVHAGLPQTFVLKVNLERYAEESAVIPQARRSGFPPSAAGSPT